MKVEGDATRGQMINYQRSISKLCLSTIESIFNCSTVWYRKRNTHTHKQAKLLWINTKLPLVWSYLLQFNNFVNHSASASASTASILMSKTLPVLTFRPDYDGAMMKYLDTTGLWFSWLALQQASWNWSWERSRIRVTGSDSELGRKACWLESLKLQTSRNSYAAIMRTIVSKGITNNDDKLSAMHLR